MREDDVLVQIHAAGVNQLDGKIRWASSSSFCPIASHSSWPTTWLGSCSKSERECGDSNPVTKSMHGQTRTESVLIYPDAGHGAQFQYPDRFLKHAIQFLEE